MSLNRYAVRNILRQFIENARERKAMIAVSVAVCFTFFAVGFAVADGERETRVPSVHVVCVNDAPVKAFARKSKAMEFLNDMQRAIELSTKEELPDRDTMQWNCRSIPIE